MVEVHAPQADAAVNGQMQGMEWRSCDRKHEASDLLVL